MNGGTDQASPHNPRRQTSRAAAPAADKVDRKILAELQKDGRITNHALAERVGLSASACLTRVRRLEESGVILGYHADVAPERLGPCVVVFAEVTLNNHHPADLARFEAGIAEIPEVVEASQVSGAFDYLMRVVTPDVHGWADLADELIGGGLGIDKIATRILMKTAKRSSGYPV